jgi:hypothetical protein
VDLGRLVRALARVAVSLLGGGVFHCAWLAVFLLAIALHSPVVEAALWLLAPVATGAGFAVGVVAFDRLTRAAGSGFWRIFVWPLVGCAIGAGVVYPFGPMLIVFGMLAAGTASVAAREAVALYRSTRASC